MYALDLSSVVFYLVVFHLLVFALALVILGLSALLRSLFSALHAFFYPFDRRTNQRLDEIHRIGRQARAEMHKSHEGYLDLVEHEQRR
jgi:hypothetical protein